MKKFSKYIPKIWYLSMGVQIFKWISKEHFKFLQWNFTFFKENLKGILKKYIHVTNTLIMTLFRGIRFFFLDDTFYHIDLSNHIYKKSLGIYLLAITCCIYKDFLDLISLKFSLTAPGVLPSIFISVGKSYYFISYAVCFYFEKSLN